MIISADILRNFELHNPDLFDTKEKSKHTVEVIERLIDSHTHVGSYQRDDLKGQTVRMG